MKTNDWLKVATEQLTAAGIATARLDALVLLEDALHQDRAWLLAHSEESLPDETTEKLQAQLARRAAHEPLAYIRGKCEFYGREFKVSAETLQPRPETETMISLLMKRDTGTKPCIADIGTGSGAIAITASLELPEATVMATEIQKDALLIAKQNQQLHQTRVQFYAGNLLEPLSEQKLDIVLANLPYVPDSHTINEAAMQEPAIAIFGGLDGLELYRELFSQLAARRQRPYLLFTESLPYQHESLCSIAAAAHYENVEAEDFIQVFRAASQR